MVKSGEEELPEHLKIVIENSKNNLTLEQSIKLKKLLIEYQNVFSKNDYDLGNFTALEHKIDTGDARPIKQKMRLTPIEFANEEEDHLNKMLNAGVIKPSISDWASPPVLIRKRDGSERWCLDFRALNNVTKKDTYPLPIIEECLDTLSGNVWFSKLNANSAY